MHLFSHRAPKSTQPTCAVIRYGAIGDVIQTSSLFPLLKEEGYRTTLYTVPAGNEVIRGNPHVDEVIVQDPDDVPNVDLGDFCEYLEQKYDRFINLSESVERSLLAVPGTISHTWPQSMRHKYLNHNYLEFMHDIAELPYKPRPEFFPSAEERDWALDQRAQIGGDIILWCLSGSAVHKSWPHDLHAVEQLTAAGYKVVTVGDESCKILEQGMEGNARVFRRCWVWTLRQTLAFAQVADLVFGPETGVLNAVSFEPVPKIVLLSHSSTENLTRDWVNTVSMVPADTHCYPCHRMHYGYKHCVQAKIDVNGELRTIGALCQANITPDRVVAAALDLLEGVR